MSIIECTSDKIKIDSWSVKEGNFIPVGKILFSYSEDNEKKKFKANRNGIVKKIHVPAGSVAEYGDPLVTLEPCSHPTVMRDMCAECGVDLRKTEQPSSKASVSMIHSVPDLRISMEQAQKIGKIDEERLLEKRKLVLLVDLDQTLIHTTNDIVPANLKDVFHFQLWGHGSVWYHTRLRPGTANFLQSISKMYELHICTFGTRTYANAIAKYLDPSGSLFSDRILSRDECFSQNSKTANLKELFPRGDHMVCIIDDREDVWNYAPNLIHVKPYHFFRHTGDINAPPGLSKQDEDDKTGFDFATNSKLEENSSKADEEPTNENKIQNELNLSDDDNSNESPTLCKENSSVTEASQPSSNVNDNPSSLAVDECSSNSCDVDNKCNDKKNESSEKPEDSIIQQTKPDELNNVTSENTKGEKSGVLETLLLKNECKSDSEKDVVVDADDYLIYLETILTRIYSAFYTLYQENNTQVPDLKTVIPYVRRKTFKNVSIVFSGVIPTEVPLAERKQTRAYSVAMGLGAHVSEHIVPPNKPGASHDHPTTHVVAVRMGTAKVNEARRYQNIHIVTPEWLWCCAERWEHVDERLFRLRKNNPSNKPTISSSLGKRVGSGAPQMRKERTPSGRFMDTINPLLSFSVDEIESMGHEVDDIINESESSESDEEEMEQQIIARRSSAKSLSSSSSSTGSLSSSSSNSNDSGSEDNGECRKRRHKHEEEPLNVKFRRGEGVPSEVADLVHADDDDSDDDDDDDNDQEEAWMAEALEHEILNDSSQDNM